MPKTAQEKRKKNQTVLFRTCDSILITGIFSSQFDYFINYTVYNTIDINKITFLIV